MLPPLKAFHHPSEHICQFSFNCYEVVLMRASLLEVRSTDQLHRHHLGACQVCSLWPSPERLNPQTQNQIDRSSDDAQARESIRSAVLENPHLKCNIFGQYQPHYTSHGRNFKKTVLSGGKQHNHISSRKTSLFGTLESGGGRAQITLFQSQI